jgi:hypothetical protein
MSADTGMSHQSRPTRQNDGSIGRGRWHEESWKPVEILAMVLGFIVYWPIGFAVLGWKFWQKKSGYSGDIISFGRDFLRARKMGKLDELGARFRPLGLFGKSSLRFWHGLDRKSRLRRMARH